MTIVLPTGEGESFQNLSALKTSIASRLDRSFEDTDLVDFIYLAEREMERLIDSPFREASTTLSIASAYVTPPADFKQLRKFTLLTDPTVPLVPYAPEQLDAKYSSQTGTPEAFTFEAGYFRVAPAPDTTYTASLVYEAKIPALSESQASNWLLARHPDAYFYGALVQAADFIADTAKLDRYRAMFEVVIGQINTEGRDYLTSIGPTRLRSAVVV